MTKHVCLRLRITGNNTVNNVQCLTQTDHLASYGINISPGAMGINFVKCIILLNVLVLCTPRKLCYSTNTPEEIVNSLPLIQSCYLQL